MRLAAALLHTLAQRGLPAAAMLYHLQGQDLLALFCLGLSGARVMPMHHA